MLKKISTISIFAIFILCFLTHFIYAWFPNFFFSLLFPVNESIWEHMKMIVSSIIIWETIVYFILKQFDVKFNNFLFAVFVMCISSIVIFLIIYFPIYSFVGDNFILSVVCLFITIYFANVLDFYIMKQNHIKYGFAVGLIGIILIFLIFALFTYLPPKGIIFVDPRNNNYGISFLNNVLISSL